MHKRTAHRRLTYLKHKHQDAKWFYIVVGSIWAFSLAGLLLLTITASK